MKIYIHIFVILDSLEIINSNYENEIVLKLVRNKTIM